MNLRWAALVLAPLTAYAAPAPLGSDTLVYSGSSDAPALASPVVMPSTPKAEVLIAPNDLQAPVETVKLQPPQSEPVMMKAARLEVLRVMEAKAASDAAAEYEQLQRSGELADNSAIAPPAPATGSFSGAVITPVTSAPPAAPIVTTNPMPLYTPATVQPAPPPISNPPQPASVATESPSQNNTPSQAYQSDSHPDTHSDSHPVQKGNSLIDSGGGWGN